MGLGSGLKNLLTVLWIGGMWTIGVIAAPALFAGLDKATAGMVAGKLFHAIGWVGIVAGVYLAIWCVWQMGMRGFQSSKFWLVVGMLFCTLINQFAIFPLIASLKPAVSTAAEGVFGGGLAQWHTISSLIYLLQSVFGIIYIWSDSDR
ncbi:DUF4149 domain-containing protein [Iodobacter sp. LRB]|uniref:DUF4149 domain-containing protein n=1 Tax=unclassified Iodobacter TaxID=235634 RepID=UPI000C11DC34|nr:DUF4149 domain-containing protein [Iodobacter sp. BJB302]PHV01268.1 hypothetical protein CSQ88_13010 [Iodobacter sp. BJB302]